MLWVIAIAAVWYVLASGAAFLMFAFDKLRAKQREFMAASRVPEKTLLLLSAIGGFPGAALAMRVVRHKTRKPVFAMVNIWAAVGHAVVWIVALGAWIIAR